MSVRSAWARLGAICISMGLAAGTLAAQSGTSSLYGKVTDEQGGALPGVTVTITGSETGLTRAATTDGSGDYQIVAVPPGRYNVKVELQGFRTAIRERVDLGVDLRIRLDVPMAIGQMAETIEVTSIVSPINTTDASLGNVITANQVAQLPLEARNVVGLLSLQAGAVYVPNAANVDPRNGSVSGARADQSNVTLDGVDVNDPQFGTAYTSAVRVTLDSLQEFRVTTSNFGAESGRSSAAQVSLVTKSGTNSYRGSGYWQQRDTAWSSNDYFLKLAQLNQDLPSEAPKLDKKIWGGAVGGPIKKDRFFFFGNFERLNELSETPVNRSVPSDSFRDGVMLYRCAVAAQCPGGTVSGFTGSHVVPAGFYGLDPATLKALDPLGIGPSQLASQYFKQYPSPNDTGRDGYNIMGYRFASPIENDFKTYIGRLDYHASSSHNLFGRFNIQDDAVAGTQQFPGQPASTTRKVASKGMAIGHDWVIGSNKVNTLRYGWTQIQEDTIGLLNANVNNFRFMDPFEAQTSSNGRETPTHNIVNDFNWVKGSHSLKFGTNLRFSRIPRYTNLNSYIYGTANGSWVAGVGRRYRPGSTLCGPVQDVCDSLPAVASGFNASYGDGYIPILGIMSQTSVTYNYDAEGNVLPLGEPTSRKYGSNEFEFYAQDSWKIGESLTFTAGMRYSLFSPPYEVNGLQVAPDVDLGEIFETRRQNALSGIPDNQLPLVRFDLAGPANGKKGYFDWDKNNFAPRLALAWTPRAEGGLFGWLTGGDKMVIRGGYSMVYDRIGQALATQFDDVGAFGLSTALDSPFGQEYEMMPEVRFQGINAIPATFPAAPPGEFPQTPAQYAGVITSALDSSIRTPYAHSFNVVVGRELGGDYSFEAAYVGRLGRNLLIRRDMMMPLNLKDPASGDDYFTAAGKMIRAAESQGIENMAPIPYWENMFPNAAFDGLSATQNMAALFMENSPDWITALWIADQFGIPEYTSKHGSFAFFNSQYDSLAAQSSLARSEYNALQLTLRKRYSRGYQFDFNYTLGHSQDHASAVERGSFFTAFGAGGYSGFMIDSWDIEKQWGNSDFDVRHQLNVNWILEMPFGTGKPIGGGAPGWANAVIGDWSVAGLWRWTSGFPFSVQNCRSCWATNWNLQGNAELVTPGRLPESGVFRNVNGYPNTFEDPEDAISYFRFALPGESGLRNELRGDGYFTIDLSIGKAWQMPWSDNQRLRFRWDMFNITNTPRFDLSDVDMLPDIDTTFGRYNSTLATCDGGAGRCMQLMLKYEF